MVKDATAPKSRMSLKWKYKEPRGQEQRGKRTQIKTQTKRTGPKINDVKYKKHNEQTKRDPTKNYIWHEHASLNS